MAKIFLVLTLSTLFFAFLARYNPSYAVVDPLSVPNNKIGIHIMFHGELDGAAKLVNSNGGDYGYVTIPIQANDKDIEKWQEFLDNAKKLHLIPIIRLATEPHPFNSSVWRKPTDYDIVDFANFLHSLNWPYKNRYIIVYNEVNRGDEWGGNANPSEYAEILSYAVTVLKSKSPDYFVISAGLDNAAPNQPTLYMNQYTYMRSMNSHIPGIFNQIDGLSSHSYPNPGFSQHPSVSSAMSIDSFQYEQALIATLAQKKLPTFITETGWSTEAVNDSLAAMYYTQALNTVWADKNIVAITPFLLQGGGGPFQKFSLFAANGAFSQQYTAIKKFPKTRGLPALQPVLAAKTTQKNPDSFEVKNFKGRNPENYETKVSPQVKSMLKWLLRV